MTINAAGATLTFPPTHYLHVSDDEIFKCSFFFNHVVFFFFISFWKTVRVRAFFLGLMVQKTVKETQFGFSVDHFSKISTPFLTLAINVSVLLQPSASTNWLNRTCLTVRSALATFFHLYILFHGWVFHLLNFGSRFPSLLHIFFEIYQK